MKVKTTDLAQYELLNGDTTYEFDFPLAPSVELLIDIYADRPCSLFLHIVRNEIDKWVPVVSSERRLEFRGRFGNCVGARIHAPKDATLNALVIGNPVGVDPINYTPRTAKLEVPQPTMGELVAREVRKLLPPKPQREVHPDPELMGDEIAEQHRGYEIDDDDPLDGFVDGVLEDEPARDPRPDPDRARESGDPRPAPDNAPIPDAVAGGDGS